MAIITFLVSLLTVSSAVQSLSPGNQTLLKDLVGKFDSLEVYENRKIEKIQRKKEACGRLDGREQMEAWLDVAYEYSYFDSDSTIAALERVAKMASDASDHYMAVKTASATELTVIAPENELGIYKVVVTVGKQTVEGFEFEYVKPELVYTVSSDVHSGNKLMFLTGMAMLPDGRLAVSCRATHEIKVFDLQNKKQSVLVNKYADAHPWNISMNPDDKMLYIAYKAKGEIGRMDPSKGDGQNVEIVVSGHANMMDVKFDAKGNMYVLVRDERKIYKYPKGQFNNASAQVFVNLDGKGEGLYSMDFDVDGNLIIGSQRDGFYLAAPDGKVTKIVGNGGGSTDGEVGQPLTAQFVQPVATVVDKTRGDIYFADPYNQKIRRIRPGKKGYEDATVSTVAGTGVGGNSDGDGATATLKMPYGMTMTADGSTIYFSDMDNQIIRKISVTEK